MLQASRIPWDLRKVDQYECYNEFDWEVQWQKGDTLALYLVQIIEMIESIKLIHKKPSPTFELSKQETLCESRSSKRGMEDNSVFPWRWKIRPPCHINLQFLPQLVYLLIENQ
ncbi:hypothetical protein AMTRI_Chr01g130880 [Amborella trichopoda]